MTKRSSYDMQAVLETCLQIIAEIKTSKNNNVGNRWDNPELLEKKE